MPPKKLSKQQKKNADPLVCYNSSRPFYKAFVFEDEEDEMYIDTSGEIFSLSPQHAVVQLFRDLPVEKRNRMPNLEFVDKKGNPIANDIPEDQINPYLSRMILVKMRMNWDAEFTKIKTEVSEYQCLVELKDAREGYQMAMQDYILSDMVMQLQDLGTSGFDLVKFKATCADPDCTVDGMPDIIEFDTLKG